ncbi:MAG: hypothetical protein AAF202_12905, partial [Pseudomonadota bacterium]
MQPFAKLLILMTSCLVFTACIEDAEPPVASNNGGAQSFFYTRYSGTPLNSNTQLSTSSDSQSAAANWGIPSTVTY